MIHLYNTLTKNKDPLKVKGNKVGLYTCGPTVYNYAHLGNLRTYIFEDVLKRVLKYNGYDVYHVMNITDVGHLTGNRDMGEDKLEESAKKEKKTAWQIADYYTKAFKEDIEKLNILEPNKWCKATDHIKEQIDLIKKLENKGFTYKTKDGIYYDTSKFKNYNKLSHQPLEKLKEGARVEKNPDKKNPTDFALWKFSPNKEKRQMEWWFRGKFKGELVTEKNFKIEKDNRDTIGFPGWHIECSAMSLKYLKNNLDIHCGGTDHINVHHTNEIAQSKVATGKKFFNIWMHGAFLNIQGGKKMAKSKGNFLTLENAVIKKGYSPIAYRLMCLGAHYRKPLTWSDAAIKNFNHMYNIIIEDYKRILVSTNEIKISVYKKGMGEYLQTIYYLKKFIEEINKDLNTPNVLSYFWDIKNNTSSSPEEKITLMREMDKVLGLGLDKTLKKLPRKVEALKKEHEEARKNKNYKISDETRNALENMGYKVEDNADATSSIWKQ